ncbi:MAG: KpsF/GutQ family sugar-phosphate isomerase [Chlamydiia bacterium]|nr:KpsF/GutQ family sugar-phosphate isomerase [Chlamydiia bacterium]
MLEKLFEDQRALINAFFDAVDMKQAQAVLDACLQCKGKIVFSGVGKSGIVAEKLATTLTSTGTRAQHMTPTDALHGDIGMLDPTDLLVMLSKSGESNELIDLMPLAKMRNVKTIAWVSKPASRLAKLCDLAMELPLQKELCPFDLAPTTSSALQLIFGDILTVALMKKKQFSLDAYAMNHPAGAIGKKLTMHVRDIMLKGDALPLCNADMLVTDALSELSQKRCGCVLIVDGDRVIGIFTDGDLRRLLQKTGSVSHLRLGDVMQTAFSSVTPDVLAFDALKIMEGEKRIMVLPVIEGEHLVGIIHLHDILQAGL